MSFLKSGVFILHVHYKIFVIIRLYYVQMSENSKECDKQIMIIYEKYYNILEIMVIYEIYIDDRLVTIYNRRQEKNEIEWALTGG